MKKLIVAILLFSFSCSYQNQNINLNFNIKSNASKLEEPKRLMIKIYDQRQNKKVLGKKKYGKKEILLLANQDLAKLLRTKINKTLKNQGFIKGTNRSLEIYIKNINYESVRGFLIGKSTSQARIDVVIRDINKQKIFSKKFEINQNGKYFISTSKETDSKIINDLIAEILNEILSDQSVAKNINPDS